MRSAGWQEKEYSSLAIVIVCVPHLGNLVILKSDLASWDSVKFNLQQILLLVIVVQAAFPVSSFLIRIFNLMSPVEEDEKQDNGKPNAKANKPASQTVKQAE